MATLKQTSSTAFWVILFLIYTTGCQISYIVQSGYNQVKLLNAGEPIDDVLRKSDLPTETKRKLQLAQEARKYASEKLGLNSAKNYSSYVDLKRSHVTYVVSASDKWALKAYTWWFPIIGSVPYKGFFTEEDAKSEAQYLQKLGSLDVTYRGVSAYSTLGWFHDPLLSSMLQYQDIDLVETIIHESVHATFYIAGEADFNERAANFIGIKGAADFYREKEGASSPTLAEAELRLKDEMIFSGFMSAEIKQLDQWYKQNKSNISEGQKQERLQEIQKRFSEQIRPQLQRVFYKRFENTKLNNAELLLYKTYSQDLSQFENLYIKFDKKLPKVIQYLASLKYEWNPTRALSSYISSSTQ